MNSGISSMALLGALMACGRSAIPPDPPALAQVHVDTELNPLPVSEIEVDHSGCFGPCPNYRVRITSAGVFEYEGRGFVREGGRMTASMYPADIEPLFLWLRDHPALYSKSTTDRHGDDTENVSYRFRLKNGDVVVVESDIGFLGDDLWALSSIVDGLVVRALIRSKVPGILHELKPAT